MVSMAVQQAKKAKVTEVIRSASRVTGVSFDYLMRTAQRESSFDPTLKASTSSATGLYQFIDSTWLGMMKEAGPQLGLQAQADAIEKTAGGKYQVADAAQRQALLDLRYDPQVNALMAGAFTQRNQALLGQALGRAPVEAELYTAHVMGASGALRLIELAQKSPTAAAADVFPEAAAANRALFYHPSGAARTSVQVMDKIAGHFSAAPMAMATLTQMQEVQQTQPLSMQKNASIQENVQEMFGRRRSGAVAQGMFQPEGRQVVSSVVQGLWGRPQAATPSVRGVADAVPVRPAFYPSTSGVVAPMAAVPSSPKNLLGR